MSGQQVGVMILVLCMMSNCDCVLLILFCQCWLPLFLISILSHSRWVELLPQYKIDLPLWVFFAFDARNHAVKCINVIKTWTLYLELICFHDNIIKWKYFLHYWPFVRGNHWSPLSSPHKGQWCCTVMFSLICICLKKWMSKQSKCRWLEMLSRSLWHHFNVVVLCSKINNHISCSLICPMIIVQWQEPHNGTLGLIMICFYSLRMQHMHACVILIRINHLSLSDDWKCQK